MNFSFLIIRILILHLIYGVEYQKRELEEIILKLNELESEI